GDRAAILRPAGNVVANRNRTLLAVGNRPHALAGYAARHQIFAHRLGAAGAERDVVLARAALVGVAFDGEVVAVVVAEPLRLLVERGARLLGELRRIGFEENAIADVNDEILLAARCGSSAHRRRLVSLVLGAARDHQSCGDDSRIFG